MLRTMVSRRRNHQDREDRLVKEENHSESSGTAQNGIFQIAKSFMSKTLIPNVPGWMLHDTAKYFEVVEIDDPIMLPVRFLKTLPKYTAAT